MALDRRGVGRGVGHNSIIVAALHDGDMIRPCLYNPPPMAAAQYDDPDLYRMTLGDHLEELRKRLILGLLGFAVAAAGCLFFGKYLITVFCAPLIRVLQQHDVNSALVTSEVGEGFMVYLEISLITAVVIAAPWLVWQLWQFVAAGLYPNERKTITRYVPLSILLLIAGDLFVYFFVLPLTLQFFIAFGLSFSLPTDALIGPPPMVQVHEALPQVPVIAGNPSTQPNGAYWYDSTQQKLKIAIDGKVRVIGFTSDNLLSPLIKLSDYIDLVLNTLIVFALSFQLPLVVLTLAKINIVDVPTLKKLRRFVYFGLAVAACAIMPADAITAATGLFVPLMLLYELGIFLAARAAKENPPMILD